MKVLRSEQIKNSISKYEAHFTDNPVHSLDLGVFWLEKVLRHGDLPFTRIRGRDLGWLDYLHYESVLFILFLLYILS